MIKLYSKQAFHLLKENKLLSSISIIGTALAIIMIIVIMVTLRTTIVPLAPESYRDCMLILRYAGFQYKTNENWQSNGPVFYKTAKACSKGMAAPKAVTIASSFSETMLAAKSVGEKVSCDVLQVDGDFWKVFRFDFLSGHLFNKATFDAGATRAVISEDMARQLFGTSGVVGKTFLLNHSVYMICGVVRPVPKLARYAYVQVWVLSGLTDAFVASWDEYGIMGTVGVYILAKSQDDFPAIRMGAERLRDRYMEGYPGCELFYRNRPNTYFVTAQRYLANNPPAMEQAVRQYTATLIILLAVSAVNPSELALSCMRKRLFETGVRKVFGAPRHKLMIQVLSGNMPYSLLGRVLRLVLSYGATFLLGSMLLSIDFMGNGVMDLRTMCMDLLFDPVAFLLAFLACSVPNLLSTAILAQKVTRTNIVDTINER